MYLNRLDCFNTRGNHNKKIGISNFWTIISKLMLMNGPGLRLEVHISMTDLMNAVF